MRKLLFICSVLLFCLSSIISEEVSSKGLVKIKETRTLKSVDEYQDAKRWAIVIGVNDYEDSFISDLQKAMNDAKVMADVLKNEGQFDYVYLFTDDNDKKSEYYPSVNNIISKMSYLEDEIKPNDTVMFTFSGHGISDDDNKSYLILADTVISHPYKTSLPLYEIQNWLEKLKVKKNIVLLDACRNNLEKSKGVSTKTLMEEKNSQAEVSAVVYSTSPGEFSYESDVEPYGVFTSYIIDGMRGKADSNNDVLITFNELREFVEKGVKDWALEHNKKQKPFTSIKGEFTGDVALSVIPLKERAKYNPLSLSNNYKLQMRLYEGLNYSSFIGMGVSFFASAVGGIIFGVGYNGYLNTPKTSLADWELYRGMTQAGIYTAIAGGALGISFTIPLGISYTVKPKAKAAK